MKPEFIAIIGDKRIPTSARVIEIYKRTQGAVPFEFIPAPAASIALVLLASILAGCGGGIDTPEETLQGPPAALASTHVPPAGAGLPHTAPVGEAPCPCPVDQPTCTPPARDPSTAQCPGS